MSTTHNQGNAPASYYNDHQPLQRLIELCAAQLKLSEVESSAPIASITKAFIELSADITELSEQYPELPMAMLQHRVADCVIKFQFFDRMSQQIEHVIDQLQGISNTLLQTERSIAEQLEQQMVEVQDYYSMDSQREIYRAVLEGQDITNLLIQKKKVEPKHQDDIDLF